MLTVMSHSAAVVRYYLPKFSATFAVYKLVSIAAWTFHQIINYLATPIRKSVE